MRRCEEGMCEREREREREMWVKRSRNGKMLLLRQESRSVRLTGAMILCAV
jgi:hypothetical protein